MMIYLASDQPLRKIDWNEDEPGFYISDLSEDEERVRCQFKMQNVRYAGSHEGCGCGFQYGECPRDCCEPDELKQRRRSLDHFARYLREELARGVSIELYACWDGDQEVPPEHHRVLTPSSLEADDFFFVQRELTTITETATETPS